MSRFDVLTKYISMIQSDSIGKWIVDNENDGTLEHPIQMQFVAYSNLVNSFQMDLYKFCDEHPEYEHTRYNETLENNCLVWNTESMQAADVSKLDAKCVIALLIGASRADRFCEGALLNFFEIGCILKWLVRLNNIE
jgi:hypothetical protein